LTFFERLEKNSPGTKNLNDINDLCLKNRSEPEAPGVIHRLSTGQSLTRVIHRLSTDQILRKDLAKNLAKTSAKDRLKIQKAKAQRQ